MKFCKLNSKRRREGEGKGVKERGREKKGLPPLECRSGYAPVLNIILT